MFRKPDQILLGVLFSQNLMIRVILPLTFYEKIGLEKSFIISRESSSNFSCFSTLYDFYLIMKESLIRFS